MGLRDWLLGRELERREPPAGLFPVHGNSFATVPEGSWYEAVMSGAASTNDALLSIPAVNRAVTFIQSACASMPPVAFRDGVPMEEQPKLVARPSSYMTRHEFIGQTVDSMVEKGEAFWWVPDGGRDYDGYATELVLIPDHDEVGIDWDESRLTPVYTWRGRKMIVAAGRSSTLVHIPLTRKAGQLHGRTWLRDCATSLAMQLAADAYAGQFFTTASIPSGVIKVPTTISAAEAKALKDQFIEGQQNRTPAVLSGGIDYAQTQTNPYEAQLTDTRRFGVTETARASGLPAAILLVEMQGAFDVYANLTAVFEEACRSTLFPLYLNPIEAALTDLLPRTQVVRFDASEMLRLDQKGRYDVYTTGVAAGILDPEEVRTMEGLPPRGADQVAPVLAPTPPTAGAGTATEAPTP